MSNPYPSAPQRVTISAGTAFKIGFFGALGATVFSIILGVIGFIVAAIAGASLLGLFGSLGGN